LIRYAAAKRKTMLISTGMSTLEEVGEAVRSCLEVGNERIVLLHCSCDYPPKYEDINLNAMETMKETFGFPVGYSDHSQDIFVPIAAATLGAAVIEKHFTLDNNMPGPDHVLSLDPENFRRMVEGIRAVEKALGSFKKKPALSELPLLRDGRRGLVAARNIPKGRKITREMVKAIKPADGISPKYLNVVLEKKAQCDIIRAQPIKWDDI